MMRDLLIICFLATFIATGASLSCEVCEGLGDTCMGPLHTCSPGFNTCGIIQEETTMGPHCRTIVKTCFSACSCDGGLTVINLGRFGTVAKKLTCCEGHECAEVPAPLPALNTTPNGRKCPACYAMHGFTCKEEVAHCAGDELYCLELAGTTSTNLGGMMVSNIMKGCSNIAACNDTIYHTGSFPGMTVVTSVSCTLASGAAGSMPDFLGLFSFFVSGVLLRKIFS